LTVEGPLVLDQASFVAAARSGAGSAGVTCRTRKTASDAGVREAQGADGVGPLGERGLREAYVMIGVPGRKPLHAYRPASFR
jgi:hypothetical protein